MPPSLSAIEPTMDGSLPDPASAAEWLHACPADDILPNLGVCVLLRERQIAIFRVLDREGGEHYYAIDNHDPQSGANVLARGLTGSLNGRVVVASPIYKHHYDLRSGECLEEPATPVGRYDVRVEQGQVWVAV